MFILLFIFILKTFSPYKTIFFSFDSHFADAISKPPIQNKSLVGEKWVVQEKRLQKKLKIRFPGFFEIFPELRIKWPKWSRDKRGYTIPCATDTDCPFPQTCCNDPIIPGERKFCCTGWGRRQMIPAYVRQEIQWG